MEDAYQYHEVNSEQPEQSQNNDEPPKKKSKIKKILMILSILVDTFISKISLTMQPGPKIDSISGA